MFILFIDMLLVFFARFFGGCFVLKLGVSPFLELWWIHFFKFAYFIAFLGFIRSRFGALMLRVYLFICCVRVRFRLRRFFLVLRTLGSTWCFLGFSEFPFNFCYVCSFSWIGLKLILFDDLPCLLSLVCLCVVCLSAACFIRFKVF